MTGCSSTEERLLWEQEAAGSAPAIPTSRLGLAQPPKLPRAGETSPGRHAAGWAARSSLYLAQRDMAQFGSAPGWGPGGRQFESVYPDDGETRERSRTSSPHGMSASSWVMHSRTTSALPGYGAAWQRASFGTKRSLVQIQLPRRDPKAKGLLERGFATCVGCTVWGAQGGRTPQTRGNRVSGGGHRPRSGFDSRGIAVM